MVTYQFAVYTRTANNNSVFSEENRITDEIDATANDIAYTERRSANLISLVP